MNRMFISLLLLSALIVAAAPVATAEDAGEGVFGRIQRTGELRVGVLSEQQFPYFFWMDGNPAGFEADLAADIANRLGVRLTIDSSFHSRGEIVTALDDGRVDIALSKYKRNLDDALRVRFSIPYSRVGYVLLVNRKSFASLKTEDDPQEVVLKRVTSIGTLDDRTYRSYLHARFPLARIASYPSTTSLYEALLRGKCLAGFVDSAEARQLLEDQPDLGLRLQYIELESVADLICVATSWREPFFADWIDILIESRGRPVAPEVLIRQYEDGVQHGKQAR